MEERPKPHPWVFVNDMMRDDYRELLVETALQHLPRAALPVQRFAGSAFSHIQVPGFRALNYAPVRKAKQHVLQTMKRDSGVTAAVVALWADAQRELVNQLKDLAEDLGWEVRSDWTWVESCEGFYAVEDFELGQILSERIEREYEEPTADHLLLATLWLSAGLQPASEEQMEREQALDLEPLPETVAPAPDDSLVEEGKAEPTTLQQTSMNVPAGAEPESIEVLGQPLDSLVKAMREGVQSLKILQQSAIAKVQELVTLLQDQQIDQAQVDLQQIENELHAWDSQESNLYKVTREVALRVTQELDARPDLDPDHTLREGLREIGSTTTVIGESTIELVKVLDEIDAYDKKKEELLTQLDEIQSELVFLLSDLATWDPDTPATETQLVEPITVSDEVTLETVREEVEETQRHARNLRKRLAQRRDSTSRRVLNLVQRLDESGELPNDAVSIEGDLTTIDLDSLLTLSAPALYELEQSLEALLTQQVVAARSSERATLAAQLLNEWDVGEFRRLLQTLAQEGRDAETVLLLLSSLTSNPPVEAMDLNAKVVDSFFRGLDRFSEEGGPAELLNLGVSTLLRGWQPEETVSYAKLCLYLLAAKYAGDYQLPSEFLWQVTTEWPLGGMPGWSKLWQHALLEEALPFIVDEEHDDLGMALDRAREQMSRLFLREGGRITRLRSIKSGRHQALIREEILPTFSARWQQVGELEAQLEEASEPYEVARHLTELQKLVHDRLDEANFDDETLGEWYERAAFHRGIEDSDSFHKRTTLRVVREYAQSLTEYAAILLQYWEARSAEELILSRTSLLQELSTQEELLPLGRAVVDQLVQTRAPQKPEWRGMEATERLHRRFLRTLLSSAVYAERLPQVVGYLVNASLGWKELFPLLLGDLSTPRSTKEVAEYLIEQRAPDQVLLLAQRIPLELQKEAQSLRVQLEKEATELQAELLKVGEDVEDVTEDRRLGRWPVAIQEITARLHLRQEELESQTAAIQEQARRLLTHINEIEMDVFEMQSSIPAGAYELLGQGLSLARSAARQLTAFEEVREFLSDMRYRLAHEAWPLEDLQSVVERLRDAIRGESTPGGEHNAEQVLDLLACNELRALGMSSGTLAASEVETRIDVLQNWLAVRELPSFLSEDLSRADREKIHKLFSAFTRMTAMSRVYAPTGSPITYEEPVVFAYWKLKYPAVSMLERDCILVALPGAPPSPAYLKQLDNLVEDREWLRYEFVFLFAPGLTPAQLVRLQQRYKDQGLVIIDEETLIKMVLAEADSRIPLGRLRAMMLNAYGALNVDVFKVNQAVDPRMGIFVGRDYIVRKIASSGDNYALYGGRRIGKSSILNVVGDQLQHKNTLVIAESFEGIRDCTDNAVARILARRLPDDLGQSVSTVEDLKGALRSYLDSQEDARVAFLLDEIDRYIEANPNRHVLIEALRTLAEQYGNRFRVIVAGFMYLYDRLQGRGPYTPSSDPWQRMLNEIRLENLRAESAEKIVKEGFLNILGWDFENHAVARWIVERTSGHPAFVQYFCMKLQKRVAEREDRCVYLQDVTDVFADENADDSFIVHVNKTLALNLGSVDGTVGRYIILWLAKESSEMQGFTFDQAREIAELSGVQIPEKHLQRALERLKVTSVVEERSRGVYDFSVPDYPRILDRLGSTAQLDELESKLWEHFGAE